MLNLDTMNEKKTSIFNALADAVRGNDAEGMQKAMNEWQGFVTEQITEEAKAIVGAADSTILASRGVRQLTSEETAYYNKLIGNAQNAAVEGVVTGIEAALPQTVIEAIFDDMKQAHPLLNAIDFQNTTAITKMVVNKQGPQTATWDALNTEITKKLVGEIETFDMTLAKLTAYMFVTKDMLALGPVWVDKYTRTVLSEALAVGLETAIVDGDGVKKPVGMTRNFTGSFNNSTGYARKNAKSVDMFTPPNYGDILSTLATIPNNGGTRAVSEVILIVNPADYFSKVMPATTVMAPDGTYRNDVFPFPTKVVQSVGVPENHAVIGIAKRYFMGMGTSKDGKLEYDDSYKFLEDLRTYTIRLYGMGRPLDINSFIYLDITNLVNPTFTVNTNDVTPASP